jgi:hypothetical protein
VTIEQHRPSDDRGAERDGASVEISLPAGIAYLVIVVTPYGNPRRRAYLCLHHATAALRRAQKGQPARMVLCQLKSLELGGVTATKPGPFLFDGARRELERVRPPVRPARRDGTARSRVGPATPAQRSFPLRILIRRPIRTASGLSRCQIPNHV